MKIGILGTRGIPNHHGGFEQFAEFFAVYLVENGHDVYVYNSSIHPYQEKEFNGVKLIYCKDPEDKIGTAGQFLYDLNCIRDSRKRNFDILLQLGYTSSSIWGNFLPKKSIVITNMDGLEWKRSKYSKPVRRFLKFAEKRAVKTSDKLVADSIGIQKHLKSTYGVDSEYIAYGAEVFHNPDPKVLEEYGLEQGGYNMLIARMEPENNIEIIIKGAVQSNRKTPLVVIGKWEATKFGQYLKSTYVSDHIIFMGGIYNLEHLNNLRHFSNLYFHGHSVGGTNPSLLEAMASKTLIVAHDNIFNKSILQEAAFYFSSADDISKYIDSLEKKENMVKVNAAAARVDQEFNWQKINSAYLEYFKSCIDEIS